MNTKHTPGPWYYGTNDGIITNSPGTPLAKAIGHAGDIDMIANARLIAAAPELLDALNDASQALAHAIHRLKDDGSFSTSIAIRGAHEKALSAIARATGE